MKKPKIKPDSQMLKRTFYIAYHSASDEIGAESFRYTYYGAENALAECKKNGWFAKTGWRIVKVRISECK